jgi:hypothetical protein
MYSNKHLDSNQKYDIQKIMEFLYGSCYVFAVFKKSNQINRFFLHLNNK